MSELNRGVDRLKDDELDQVTGGTENASRCPFCGSMVSDSIFESHKAQCQQNNNNSNNASALLPFLLRLIRK